MTIEKSSLLRRAESVHAARATLEHTDVRLAELRGKSRDLEALKTAVVEARDHRAKTLEDALLAGMKPRTDDDDKAVSKAVLAFQKREDEAIATARALQTLEAQRQVEQTQLDDATAAYQEAGAAHDRDIAYASNLAVQYHQLLAEARQVVAKMPSEHFREQLLNARAALLDGDAIPSAQDVQALVICRAREELSDADALAAIPPPPTPKCLGWVWTDGALHDEPEPELIIDAASLYKAAVADGVGLLYS